MFHQQVPRHFVLGSLTAELRSPKLHGVANESELNRCQGVQRYRLSAALENRAVFTAIRSAFCAAARESNRDGRLQISAATLLPEDGRDEGTNIKRDPGVSSPTARCADGDRTQSF